MRVNELIDMLRLADHEATVKIAVASKNGISTVLDFGFLSTSTPEVHGLEIILHPDYE